MEEANDGIGSFGKALRRATLRLSLLYWACMFVADSILGYFINIDPIDSAPLKVVLFSLSALMTYAMSLVLFRLRRYSFTQKALLCFGMTAIAAPIFTGIDFLNYAICEYPEPVKFDKLYAAYMLIEGASMMFGWSCLFMALLYNFEVRDRERRLAAVREEALTAQMQALRYQVNPHFLFNTLNSIAGLIEEGAATRAERMVQSLSNFLRTSLALDPMLDVALAEELRLQQDYLAIERERYADRMDFVVDVPEQMHHAMVPSLLLQPLIENAIKHGVGQSLEHTQIRIWARRRNESLCMAVENTRYPNAARFTSPEGLGIGLRNVAERIRVRFGDAGAFRIDAADGTRFRVEIELPWRTA
ncbi:sensor histidine kinase [Ottowia thiooxydans]|uniref:Two-component system LytT family sensor kinase n=1 Tax=Ottowia thiooxydans TaxID=219182 RepID=A0ABV2QD73_9BURK